MDLEGKSPKTTEGKCHLAREEKEKKVKSTEPWVSCKAGRSLETSGEEGQRCWWQGGGCN